MATPVELYHQAKALAAQADQLVQGWPGDLGPNAAQIEEAVGTAAADMAATLQKLADGLTTAIAGIAAIKLRSDACRDQAGELEAAIGALVAQLRPPKRLHASGLPWRSGFRMPKNTAELVLSEYPKVEAWRGRRLDVVPQFLGLDLAGRGWAKLASNYVLGSGTDQGTLGATFDGGWTPTLAIPALIQAAERRFDLLAAGELDDEHDLIAQRIAAIAGDRLLYIRLGWEMDEGYPWSLREDSRAESAARLPGLPDWRSNRVPDTAQWQEIYRQGWARIAHVYKSRLPGARMVWNHLRNTRVPMRPYYPGSDVVDVIGMDPYDNGGGGNVVDEASWARFAGTYDPATGHFTGPAGMVAFAQELGRKVAFCEWGAVNRTKSPADPTNNGFYVRRMFQLFRELAAIGDDEDGLLEYESYFHAGGDNPHEIYPTSSYNPLVSAGYLEAYQPALLPAGP
jgi:hypothetical protein